MAEMFVYDLSCKLAFDFEVIHNRPKKMDIAILKNLIIYIFLGCLCWLIAKGVPVDLLPIPDVSLSSSQSYPQCIFCFFSLASSSRTIHAAHYLVEPVFALSLYRITRLLTG